MLAQLNKQERTITGLAALGGMLEFYDFIIYGLFSVYFAQQFFPGNDPLIVIIQSYLVFISGYIARPFGGIIFSYIGDEYGRKKVLIITIIMMGSASLGIGVLPTYEQLGISAPILLLFLRLIQGLAIGGELPATYVYISETINKNKGIAFGLTMSGVNGGLLLGMLVNFLLNYFLDDEQLREYGWRIAFIFGGLICLISYQIRKKLHETPVFEKNHHIPEAPLFYVFKNHSYDFISGIAIVSMMASLVVLTIIFMPTYLHDVLHIQSDTISGYMTFFMLVNVLAIYYSGCIVQYYDHNPFLFLKKLVLIACVAIPIAYCLIQWQQIMIGLLILAVLQGASAMITPYIITCLFEAKVRLTGVAVSYNIGFTLFGGLAPLIITWFIRAGYHIYFVPMTYLLLMLIVCRLGLLKK